MNPDSFASDVQSAHQVWLFGALRLQANRQPIILPTGKSQTLFGYLILHAATPHTRDQLADRLWPDAPPERTRRNLSDLLYRLRQALGPGWLISEGDQIRLVVDADLWVDVWAFEALAGRAEPAAWEQAVALYNGQLLPEIYDDWILGQRVVLEEQYLACLTRLGRAAFASGQTEAAHDYYLRLTRTDPLREEAYLGLMRSLARLNRLPEALEVYDRLVRLLEQELGADIQPGQALQDLAVQLRHDLAARRRDHTHNQALWLRPPFVGRQAERSALLTRLDRARRGEGGLTTVLGEAGSGKTRLLEELATAADWRGWQIVWGRSEDLSLPLPYSPLRQALVQALPTPRRQQLTHLLEPVWLAAVETHLLRPEVEQAPGVESEMLFDPDFLAAATGHVLRGLSQIASHLIILDDMQWAAVEVWPLLDRLQFFLAQLPVLFVLGARGDELRPQPVWTMLEAWDRDGTPVLHLSGFDASELDQLAHACGYGFLTADQANDLNHASGGNPLLALALLKQGDWVGEAQVSLSAVTAGQLASISEAARAALQAAATIGFRFDYDLWQMIMSHGLPSIGPLPQLAGELERAGLISLEPDCYRFAHDTLRATIYEQIDEPRRQCWHDELLTELAQRRPDEVLTLLYHAERAGRREAGAHYALAAGEQARAGFSYQAAVDYFSQAVASLPADDLSGRYRAVFGRMRALDGLTNREAQAADLDLLQTLVEQMADDARRIEVTYQRAAFYWTTGDLTQAQAMAEAGLILANESVDSAWQAALLGLLGRIAKDQGAYAQAESQLSQARDLYRELDHRSGEATMIDALGGLAWQRGDYDQSVAHHLAAADIFRELSDLRREAAALNNLGSAYWGLGDYAEARTTHERALVISRQLGDRRVEGDNLDNIGGTYWALGDYEQAIEFYSQALAIRRATDDLWGIGISLNNLATAWRDQGQPERALPYYEEALAVNRQMGRRRGEGYVRHGQGLTCFEAGDLTQARSLLQEAAAIRHELGERDNLMETQAALALVELTAGQGDSARQHLLAVLQTLIEDADRASLRQWVHYVAHCFFKSQNQRQQAKDHLRQAETAMLETAAPLSPTDRDQFLRQVPLNRRVSVAVAEFAQQITVRLARSDVPLGRPLTADEYKTVQWTIYEIEDDQFDNPIERRRHILRRLLAEAAAQETAPTDDDLAAALGVSRRTILRDMQILPPFDSTATTRRRSSGR